MRFEEAVVLEEAMRKTGLDDFGAEDFLPRLRVWLQALEEDTSASSLGRIGAYSDMVRYAVGRLRVEHVSRRYPEIVEEDIHRRIIIVGLPRSGTTHLLNLISADRRLRSMPYWESREPVAIPHEAASTAGSTRAICAVARCSRPATACCRT